MFNTDNMNETVKVKCSSRFAANNFWDVGNQLTMSVHVSVYEATIQFVVVISLMKQNASN